MLEAIIASPLATFIAGIVIGLVFGGVVVNIGRRR